MTNENFVKLKNTIVDAIVENEYLSSDKIDELKNTTEYDDMAKILVECEYWAPIDVNRVKSRYIESNK